MSYRRSIVTRATLLTRRLSLSPPLSHSLSSDNDKNKPRQYPPPIFPVNSPLSFFPVNPFAYRSLSTGSGDKAEYFADVADVLSGSGDVAGPVMSEVAVAAADSAFPVAALQYLIEGVHNVTGFNWRVAIYVRVAEPWFFLDVFTKRINLGYICFAIIGMLKSYLIEGGHNFTVFYWWASIALTTLLIRGATVPLLISTLKASTKLGLLRPELEEIKNEMQDKGMDPQAVADGQKRMQALFNQYGVTPFTPLKGLLIQGPVFLSFFLAISNMVEKVPSFKRGGAFWFTDLTTPDTLYIFPVLTALSFWITVEFNTQEGMEGNPAAKTMKKVSRIFAAVTIPITMNFPKALFCYWVTSNLFSLMYGVVLKAPGVKQFLNIPEIPVAPPSSNTDSGKPEFSFLESMKKYVAAQKHIHEQQTAEILSQRVKGLESQVKAKNKNKKT